MRHADGRDGLERLVAIKTLVCEQRNVGHEVRILHRLANGQATAASHAGKKHIVSLLDQFEHTGPNGTHSCLVFELLGPSVHEEACSLGPGNRPPGTIAWEASRQIVQALSYIHADGIAHGG